MQGGGSDWAISLDKHDEEHGTEPREQYMVGCSAGGVVALYYEASVLQRKIRCLMTLTSPAHRLKHVNIYLNLS